MLLVTQPWRPEPERVQEDTWLSVAGGDPRRDVPDDLQAWQIQGGRTHPGHTAAAASLFGTFNRSQDFYTA